MTDAPTHSPTRSPTFSPTAGKWATTSGNSLLDSLQTETDGMLLEFISSSQSTYPAYALIRDTTTPANAFDGDANSKLTYTSPSLKMVMGADGTLKYANHNLAIRSQEFDNVAWSNTNTTETSGATAPDGTSTAYTLTGDATNAGHTIALAAQVSAVSGRYYRQSCFIKAGTLNYAYINMWDSNTARYTQVFDLSDGTLGETSLGGASGTILTASMTDVGGGWYNCVVVGTITGTDWSFSIGTATAKTGNVFTISGLVQHTNAGTIQIWGAQHKAYPVHDDGTLSDYVATTTAAKYRLPIEFDTAGNPLGLLVEEARTNLATSSEDFTTFWAEGVNTATVTKPGITAPDGTTNATLFVDNSAGGSGEVSLFAAVTLTVSTTYTLSAYFKKKDISFVRVGAVSFTSPADGGVYFDLTNGTVGTQNAGFTGSIQSAGNGWYRCSATFTLGGADAVGAVAFWTVESDGAAVASTNRDGTSSVYIWGAQVEAGSFPTSYIKTTSATVTRAADNISMATSAMPFSATAGYVLVQYSHISLPTQLSIVQLDDGATDKIIVRSENSRARLRIEDGGVGQADFASFQFFTVDTNYKTASVWAVNDFAQSTNGGAAVTDTLGSLPAVTTLRPFGINGHLKYLKYLPRRVSDADLATESA